MRDFLGSHRHAHELERAAEIFLGVREIHRIHQNAGAKTALPGFPHGVRMRVGDPHSIDGMRGTITGQVSVPQIDLMHAGTSIRSVVVY